MKSLSKPGSDVSHRVTVAELLIKQADVASSRARTDGVEAFQARNLLISFVYYEEVDDKP
jgi:hypothetical protein